VQGVPNHADTLGQADDPDDWSDEKTRTEADVIKTHIRKTIEQDLILMHNAFSPNCSRKRS